MCGIAGSINFPLPVDQVKAMLSHRGPDEQTSWGNEGVQFVHARLAIQELSPAGRQPMHRGPWSMMFNGEIYNHLELREKYNLKCSSHSDTETLLHLFELKGIGILNELDGMFAMAVYNAAHQTVWLCRDRAGEKPLYYRLNDKHLVFASELKILSAILKPSVKIPNISAFLSIGYLPGDQTPFEHVLELLPGAIMQIDIPTMKSKIESWWSIKPFYEQKTGLSFSQALDETDRLLNLSVKRRMLSSDLEVGTFLSGGIDSGLVTAMASRYTNKLKTFTVSFEGLYNEAPLAFDVAKHLGSQHHEIPISFDHLETDLETIFRNYGEPIMDDSIIPSYYVAKESRKHLTVVLNGDAGDEIFAGYRRYVPFAKFDLFSGRNAAWAKLLQSFLPGPSDKMSVYNYAYRLLNLLSSKGADAYLSATNDLLYKNKEVFLAEPHIEGFKNAMEEISSLKISPLRRMLLLDFNQLLPAILLVKMDIATMAHALEGRSPFLSKELLEFAPTLPDEFKIKGSQTKYLLRELAKKYLPANIVGQPKRGFEIPLRDWVDTKFRRIMQDNLGPGNAFVKEILKPDFVTSLLQNTDKRIHPEQRAKLLFALLSVECWYKNRMTC